LRLLLIWLPCDIALPSSQTAGLRISWSGGAGIQHLLPRYRGSEIPRVKWAGRAVVEAELKEPIIALDDQ
jgi:hypothetical protein